MLYQLQTLKSESSSRQEIILTELAERNLDLAEHITALCQEQSGGHVFRFCNDLEPRDVVKLALVTLVYADIGTIPDHDLRYPYIEILQSVCWQIGVDWNDIMPMHEYYASALADLVEQRSIS